MSKKKASSNVPNSNGPKTDQDSVDWQLTKTNMIERLQYIYNTERYSDVWFIVGKNKQRIPAHKLVLSIASPVFETMFSANWTSGSSEIQVTDMEPSTFLTLLKFLYYDHAGITADNVMSTLNAAKKYAVPVLEKHCVTFLTENLNAENAFTILMQAEFFDESELKDKCLKIIDGKASAAIQAKGFESIDLNTLSFILKRDTLGVDEFELFEAVVRWTEAECARKIKAVSPINQVSVLGSALNLIRFPLMTIEEFSSGVADSGFLSDTQVASMFKYFVSKKKQSFFIERPRSDPHLIVSRFSNVVDGYPCDGTDHSFGFSTNRDVQLIGIGMYGSSEASATYQISLCVLRTMMDVYGGFNTSSMGTTIFKNVSPRCSGQNTFRIFLQNPVKIMKNMQYNLTYTIQGPDSFQGVEGEEKVLVKLPGASNHMLKVCFSQSIDTDCYQSEDEYYDELERGQLPELIFTQ